MVNLPDLKPGVAWPSLPSLPRSVLLHNFGTGNRPKEADFRPYVVAGLADGSVACVGVRDEELRDVKMFPLGTAPVALARCSVDGKRAVFANGSLSSVLYWDKQRLRQSHVMVKVGCCEMCARDVAHVMHRMFRRARPSTLRRSRTARSWRLLRL